MSNDLTPEEIEALLTAWQKAREATDGAVICYVPEPVTLIRQSEAGPIEIIDLGEESE